MRTNSWHFMLSTRQQLTKADKHFENSANFAFQAIMSKFLDLDYILLYQSLDHDSAPLVSTSEALTQLNQLWVYQLSHFMILSLLLRFAQFLSMVPRVHLFQDVALRLRLSAFVLSLDYKFLPFVKM